jgi:hypothetical protein
MLKSYGAKIEPSGQDDSSDEELQPDADVDMNDITQSDERDQSSKHVFDETKGTLVAKNGTSRYFDR